MQLAIHLTVKGVLSIVRYLQDGTFRLANSVTVRI